ncbi:JDVT-CTERM system glutamic-type intramembrane protease [Porticoccaceae bacterium]|nr:JDVT-CTERM system glutamic-type intramembrane protease [Porticoccaceae bacterium]
MLAPTSSIVLFPVLEETLFHGLLQPMVAHSISGHWRLISAANLITSLIFALFHLINHTPQWAVATFFPSLVFGYAYERYRNIVAPTLIHSVYHAGFFLLVG